MKSWRDFCTPALTIETDMESPSHFSGKSFNRETGWKIPNWSERTERPTEPDFFACHSIEVFITAMPEPAYSIKVNGVAG